GSATNGMATSTAFYWTDASSRLTAANASTTALTVSGTAYFPGSGIWNSSGNVGIGTTSPFNGWADAPDPGLHLEGTDPTIGFFDTSGGAERWALSSTPSAFSIINDTDGLSRFNINNDGNVGIGTASPYANLHIYGDNKTLRLGASNVDGSNFSSTIELAEHANADGTLRDGGKVGYNSTNSQERLFLHAYYDNIDSGGIDILKINGNVGIATTTPYAKLSIWNTDASGTAFNVVNNSSSTLFSVLGSGNVGIGTTTPGTLLSLGNTTDYINLNNTATSTYAYGINLDNGCFAIDGVCVGGSSSSGTVTSVAASVPIGLKISGTPITTSGTLAFDYDILSTYIPFGSATNEMATSSAFYFTDATSNLYAANASTTALTVSGTAYFPGSGIWNSSGNVGVGTTAPESSLHILTSYSEPSLTSTAASGFRIDSIGAQLLGGISSGSYAWFQTSHTSADGVSYPLILNPLGGNIGIGTTSPYAKLSVMGESVLGNSATAGYFVATSTTATSTFAGGLTVDETSLVVDHQTGYVGIGTAAPDSALLIKKAISGWQLHGENGVNYYLGHNSGYGLHINTANVSDSIYAAELNNGSEDVFVVYNSGRTYFKGNVGIGTTSPSTKLSVESPIDVNHGQIQLQSSDNDSSGISFWNQSGSTQADSRRWQIATNYSVQGNLEFLNSSSNSTNPTNSLLTINKSGNVGIGTTAPATALEINKALPSVSPDYYGLLALMSTDSAAIDKGGGIGFGGSYTGTTQTVWSAIHGRKEIATDGDHGGYLSFWTRANGSQIAENMRITSTGSVGIGTTSPYAKLSVAGDGVFATSVTASYFVSTSTATSTFAGGIQTALLDVTGSATSSFEGGINLDNGCFAIDGVCVGSATNGMATSTAFYWTDASSRLTAANASTTALTVSGTAYFPGSGIWNSSGYVGIGTTEPTQVLTVSRSQNSSTLINITNGTNDTDAAAGLLLESATSNAAFFAFPSDYLGPGSALSHLADRAGFLSYDTAAGIDILASAATADMRFFTGGALPANERMRILSGGDIGIGTTTPQWKLQVAGTTPSLALTDTSALGNQQHWLMTSMGGNFYISTSSNAYATSSPSALTITNAGNVGVGTVSPNSKLQVMGTRSDPSLIYNASSVALIGTDYVSLAVTTQTASPYTISLQGRHSTTNPGVGYPIALNPLGGNVGIGTTIPLTTLQVGLDDVSEPATLGSLTPKMIIMGAANNTTEDSVLRLIRPTNSANLYPAAVDFKMSSYGALGSPFLPKTQLTIGLKASTGYDTGDVVNVMTLRDNGNVGIGTTSPYARLSVEGESALGNSATAGYFVATSTTATSTFAGGFTAGTNAGFAVNATAAANSMYINSAGNVGIGTAAPGAKLEITGDLTLSNGATRTISVGSGSGNDLKISAGNRIGSGSGGNLYLDAGESIETDQPNVLIATIIEGNVGIGTTTPQWKLQIAGSTPSIALTDMAVGSNGHWLMTSSGGNFYIGTSSTSYITSSPSALTITNAGYVGIGTTTPMSALSIKSTTANQLTIAYSDAKYGTIGTDSSGLMTIAGNQGAGGNVYVDTGSNFGIGTSTPASALSIMAGASASPLYIVNSSNAVLAYMNSAGELGIAMTNPSVELDVTGDIEYTGTITDASDERLKENITSLNGSLDKIMQLDSVSFNMIGDTRTHLGFIAQNVQTVFPETVSIIDPINGYLGVDYTQLIAPTIKALQELNASSSPLYQGISISSGISTTSPFMNVDMLGNIGIGTSSPSHKLEVAGDLAALGFINISARDTKTDIEYLSDADYEKALETITNNVKVATYSYKSDPVNTTSDPVAQRLGLIAEEAPREILSADGRGIDLYKMASFTLAGVKAVNKKVDEFKLEVASLESRIEAIENNPNLTAAYLGGKATNLDLALETVSGEAIELSTDSIASLANSLFSSVLNGFRQLGIAIEQGMLKIQNIIADRVQTNKVAINVTPPNNAAGEHQDPTIGAGQINLGEKDTYILNNQVSGTAKIFITPEQPVALGLCQQVAERAIIDGKDMLPGFRVCLAEPATEIIRFNWWIIETVTDSTSWSNTTNNQPSGEAPVDILPSPSASPQPEETTAPLPTPSPETPAETPTETPVETPATTDASQNEPAPSEIPVPIASETPTPLPVPSPETPAETPTTAGANQT
ncbi:MAG: hypothetical protein UU87_C0005G0017, partial [Parcubacteria group bacterium GW2011_GWA2_42_11]